MELITLPSQNSVAAWGDFLNSFSWDYFSTITYRYDIKRKRNIKLMTDLERYLSKYVKDLQIFWVMEYTHSGRTHNHMLLKGIGAPPMINDYLLRRKLIDARFVKHLPFDRAKGANYYVSKYINCSNIEYGIVVKG